MKELNKYRKQISKLCDESNVRMLLAFGSVVNDALDEDSDIDLLVDFNDTDPHKYTNHYYHLKFTLEDMFKRPIDLLEQRALKNKYLKREIENTSVLLYGNKGYPLTKTSPISRPYPYPQSRNALLSTPLTCGGR